MNKEQIIKKVQEIKELVIKETKKIVSYAKKRYPIWRALAIKYINIAKENILILYTKAKSHPRQSFVAICIFLATILLINLGTKETIETTEPITEIELKEPTKEVEVTKKDAVQEEVIVEEEPIEEEVIVEEPIEEEAVIERNLHKEIDKVVLNFTATTEKPILFDIYYTNKREVWFDANHYISHQGEKGTNEYSIVLPEDSIYRIRIDFGENPGKVTIKNIYLSGTQFFDLGDYSIYELNQLENVKYRKNSYLTFTSTGNDPYIAYRRSLRN